MCVPFGRFGGSDFEVDQTKRMRTPIRSTPGRKFVGSFGQNANFGVFGSRKWISRFGLKRTALTSRPQNHFWIPHLEVVKAFGFPL